MFDVVNPFLQWLNAHPHLAGLGTFIISTAESVAIIGTIVPGSVMMTAIGALAGAGVIPLWSTIFWAILGAIVGDGISYRIGYSFKENLHNVRPFKTRPYLLEKGEAFFHKFGGMSVFIGRFVGPVRAIVPLVAGMLGMKPWRFYLANVASAIGWAPVYMLPGILLGAASLELPPDIAVHAMLVILLFILFIILCVWVTYKILLFIGYQINQGLTNFWNSLQKSRYFFFIAQALKHYDIKETYGQLILAGYIVITVLAFLYLAFYVYLAGSSQISLNNSFFYLFRSFRTPLTDHIMLAISFLGQYSVLLPLVLTVFLYFAWHKRWHTALHVLLLGFLAVGAAEFFKYIVHSPRPWGIVTSPSGHSFPSGHAVLSLAFYLGILMLIDRNKNLRFPFLVYTLAGTLILLIGASRIYLGAHWFTDVLGGWLLGASVLMIVILSYNRKFEFAVPSTGLIVTVFLTLFASYSFIFLTQSSQAKMNYSMINWPKYSISEQSWWQHQGDHLPLNRINRFGFASQILNLQWLGDLESIKKVLIQNGWEIPPQRDWISALHRIIDVQSAQYLPLVSPLYLDQVPAVVLTKRYNGNKNLVVLRLWDSNRIISESHLPLWVGVVEIAPRTYSWIFNHRHRMDLTPQILFQHLPPYFEIKILNAKKIHRKKVVDVPVILIKPKSRS